MTVSVHRLQTIIEQLGTLERKTTDLQEPVRSDITYYRPRSKYTSNLSNQYSVSPHITLTDTCTTSIPFLILLISSNIHLSISMPESIPLEIERRCQSIFPLQNVFIRKVKVLKKPKFDLTKLMEMHGDSAGEDTGAAVDKIAAETTVKKLAGAGGRL